MVRIRTNSRRREEREASEVGLGAGASAAAAFWTEKTAMSIITTAITSLILIASILLLSLD
ncbi:hypothetical protein Ancab_036141 [Ancistrocladus abbreviatus]